MFNKTKNKTRKYFCKYCLQCFSSEKILIEHKKDFMLTLSVFLKKLIVLRVILIVHTEKISRPYSLQFCL